ncbi:MAG TPA: hypothetical protein VN039_04170 [Nitrospira sp.]|nr:hypothetical protein [Nitrospira sp.]
MGFPDGIDGNDLPARGFGQVNRFNVEVMEDDVHALRRISKSWFEVSGVAKGYMAKRVLLATGLTHLPPNIPGVHDHCRRLEGDLRNHDISVA